MIPVICFEVQKYFRKTSSSNTYFQSNRRREVLVSKSAKTLSIWDKMLRYHQQQQHHKKNKQNLETLLNQQVECWSDRSKPAADLQFFINGDRVSINSPLFEKKLSYFSIFLVEIVLFLHYLSKIVLFIHYLSKIVLFLHYLSRNDLIFSFYS